MRKISLLGILGLFTLSCSLSDVAGLLPVTPPPPPVLSSPTEAQLANDTPTLTATLPTPTFTATPTFIDAGPTGTPFDTPTATATYGVSSAGNEDYLTPQMVGFTSVQISGSQMFYGRCQPNSVDFTDSERSSQGNRCPDLYPTGRHEDRRVYRLGCGCHHEWQ